MKYYLVFILISHGWFYDTTQTVKVEFGSYEACIKDISDSGKQIGQLLRAGYSAKLYCEQIKE